MGLITLTNIEDGQDAVANALNERFGKIVDTVNGNIDSQNLKNNAVTREKIAPQSVTSDKLFVDRYIDENGWTVVDYGTTKTYQYTISINNVSVLNGARKDNLTPIRPPVGRTNDNILMNATWFGSYSGHALVGVEKSGETPNTSDDQNPQGEFIAVMLGNQYTKNPGGSLPFTGKIVITAVEAL